LIVVQNMTIVGSSTVMKALILLNVYIPTAAFGLNHHHKGNFRSFSLYSTKEDITTTTYIQQEQSLTSNGAICTSSETKIISDDNDFIKSSLDKRQYRSILLPNNLQVLLVSDSATDVEAAAVHIKAGHFDDPVHRAGLAHFHEHMIFLGNEKYPGENDFDKFVSKNGGATNAYTDMEDTNYYFNIAPLDYDEDEDEDEDENKYDDDNENEDHDEVDIKIDEEKIIDDGDGERIVSKALSGGLDRFSQFFISPSFDKDAVERELRAIDSEYLNSMTSDSWKNYQLLKSSCNPKHPFSKFGCGNYNTLTNGGNITGTDAASSGGTSPRDDLLKFWEENYVAENMKLCVVGKAGLDQLQETVEKSFSDVRTKLNAVAHKKINDDNIFSTENSKYGIAAFGPEELGILREYIPVLEARTIKIMFAVPPSDDPVMKEYRPDRVLSHLIGHESPGSLHELLLEEGLINNLSSGTGVNTGDFSLFSLTLALTPNGMAQRDYVLSLVWQWIKLIKTETYRNSELMAKYHDEMNQISKTHFQFRENGDPTDFCSSAAELLFDYKPEKILIGSAMPGDYNETVVKAFVDRLRPDNCIINVHDQELESETVDNVVHECSAASADWQTEKWYKAKHRDVKISEEIKQKWSNGAERDSRLHLPALNDFLPTDFSLRSEDSDSISDPNTDYSKEKPKLLIDRPGLQMWHKMDRTFKVPRTSLRLLITTPNTYRSPRTMTLNRLFVKVLEDDLNSYIYDASLAGCRARVACLPSGYSVSVSGYSEKIAHLLDVVTSRMLSIIQEMKEGPIAKPGLAAKFEKATKNLLKDTKNYIYESPYETASYISRMLLESDGWHVSNYIAEMEGEYAEKEPLTMQECAKIAEECLTGRLSAAFLCMGNINEQGARDVVQLIDNHFLSQARPLSVEEIPRFRSLKMPTKKEAIRIFGPDVAERTIPVILEEVAQSESEENNAVEMILQTGAEYEMGFEGIAILELIGQMSYNSAYNQLRTKEQLGYIVSSFTRKTAGSALGFSVVVQSSTTLPAEIEKRIEAWLKTFREELELMPAEDLAKEAMALVAQLLERNMRLSDEVATTWGSIVSTSVIGSLYNKPSFDRHLKLAETLSVEGMDMSSQTASFKTKKTPEELKKKVLELWDKYYSVDSPERRVISARVYGQKAKEVYELNVGKPGFLSSYDEVKQVKQFLEQHATAPYWITRNKG